MLTVKPIDKKEDQKILCEKCFVTYNADYFAYSAYEDGVFLGVCQFGMRDGVGHIYDIAPAPDTDDFTAQFVLGRAALNFIDLCGVKDAYFEGEESRLTLAVGFKKRDDGKLYMNLEGFFTGDPCKH
jgi:hypothetical protein